MSTSGPFSLLPPAQGQPIEGTLLADFIVPGSAESVGIGFDGTSLYWPDRFRATFHRVTVAGQRLVDIPLRGCSPTVISFDSTRWFFWGAAGTEIYQISPNGACTTQFDLAGKLPGECDTGLGCNSLVDGIAYDSADDTLWYSPDGSQRVYHYTTGGILLGFFDVNDPPNDMIGECGFNYNSGVAVGSNDVIYLAANGCDTIFKFDKSGRKIGSFVVGALRHEDMECDNITFVGQATDAVWIKDSQDEHIRAFAVPQGTCSSGGGVRVERVVPNKGGNAGLVTVVIHGAAFAPGVSARLVREGQTDIIGQGTKVENGGRSIITTFDLRGRMIGTWDLVVTNPNGPPSTLQRAFNVEDGGYVRVWTDIIGGDRMRAGGKGTFRIMVGNRGNIDLYDIIVTIHISPPDVPFTISLPTPNKPGIDSSQVPVGTRSGPEMVIPVWVRSLPASSERGFRLTLTGSLPIGETISIKVRALLSSNNYTLTGATAHFEETLLARTLKLSFTLAVLDAPDDVVENAKSKIMQALSEGKTIESALEGAGNYVSSLNSTILQLWEDVWPDVSEYILDPQETLFAAIGCLVAVAAIATPLAPGVAAGLVGGCGSLFVLLADPIGDWLRDRFDNLPCINPEMFLGEGSILGVGLPYPCNPAEYKKPIRVVRAVDPNDKIGSLGAGELQFVPDKQPLQYLILFENLENATSPAREVAVVDRLDLTYLDIATLELGPISFGETDFVPGIGLREVTTDIDLRPRQDLIVRVDVRLDVPSWQSNFIDITWRLTSIDPETGDTPADPLAGFLPPNTNPPEGQGSIAFSIMPKSGLPSGTQIVNKARIIFDENSPIETGQWLNTIDNVGPSSQVSQLPASRLPGRFSVQWSGSDQDSGVLDYTVYVSEDNGPYRVWLRNVENGSTMFTGEEGKTYSFYSVARDKTGNLESPPSSPDATTRVSTPIWRLWWFWLSVGTPAVLVSTLVYFIRRRRRTMASISSARENSSSGTILDISKV